MTGVYRPHFETDPDVCNRVFDLTPALAQKHDPGRSGAALIIDITRVAGNTPRRSPDAAG